MKNKAKLFLGGLAAIAMIAVGLVAWPQTASAQGGPGGNNPPGQAQQNAPRPGIDKEQLLADALGITVEELQAAHQQAFEAAVDQAVADGLITETQAQLIKEHPAIARRGLGFLKPLQRYANVDIDMDALLADALGITVDELNAARDTAFEAGLAQAVADGRITQEQADQMKAQHDLQQYLQDKGLADQVRSLYEQAIQQAVEDGVLTQEQADAILNNPGFGVRFMMPDGFGGRGHGGRHGMAPGFGGQGFDGPRGMAPGFGGQVPSSNTGQAAPTGFNL